MSVQCIVVFDVQCFKFEIVH